MSEQTWTPEPWIADGGYRVQGPAGGHGYDVLHLDQTPMHVPSVTPAANAARIVACVNALAGIADPEAFVERARAIEEALRDLLANIDSPPAPNCSCHISSPCPDCYAWSALRETIRGGESALALPGAQR